MANCWGLGEAGFYLDRGSQGTRRLERISGIVLPDITGIIDKSDLMR